MFQSPRSGKFVSDRKYWAFYQSYIKAFQSPRSGKFVSDANKPFYFKWAYDCFNPLDRGNLYQIAPAQQAAYAAPQAFQSPRSGKFVSDPKESIEGNHVVLFQSPRSGKFVSDHNCHPEFESILESVSIP